MRRETRISYSFGPATQLPRPDGIRERRNGLRAEARACEGAARGVGVPASDRAGVWGGAPRELSVLLLGARRGKVDVDQEGALLDLAVLGRRQEDPTVLDGLDRTFVQ